MRASILAELRASQTIRVECPHCADEFSARDGSLFDATKTLPQAAHEKLAALRAGLREDRAAHALYIDRAKQRTNIAARATNIGKTVEHISPALRGFPENPTECRNLLEPIDYFVFRGLARGVVESIAIVDVKSGRARLSKRQQQIRNLVEAGKITFHTIREVEVEKHP